MSIEIRVEGTEEVERFLLDEALKAEKTAEQVARELATQTAFVAKAFCPVRTGRLRDSIRVEEAEVGYDTVAGGVEVRGRMVDYAIFVELGTRFQAPKYFMHNALNTVLQEWRNMLRQVMEEVG